MRKTLLAAIAFTLLGTAVLAQDSVVSTAPTTTSTKTVVETDGLRDALQSVYKKCETNFIVDDAYRYYLVLPKVIYKYDDIIIIYKYELICCSKDKKRIDSSELAVSIASMPNGEGGFEFESIFRYLDKDADANCETFRRTSRTKHIASEEVNNHYRTDLAKVLTFFKLYDPSK